jgi:hypothetical protein
MNESNPENKLQLQEQLQLLENMLGRTMTFFRKVCYYARKYY